MVTGEFLQSRAISYCHGAVTAAWSRRGHGRKPTVTGAVTDLIEGAEARQGDRLAAAGLQQGHLIFDHYLTAI